VQRRCGLRAATRLPGLHGVGFHCDGRGEPGRKRLRSPVR
jgi:hypothetical protein